MMNGAGNDDLYDYEDGYEGYIGTVESLPMDLEDCLATFSMRLRIHLHIPSGAQTWYRRHFKFLAGLSKEDPQPSKCGADDST